MPDHNTIHIMWDGPYTYEEAKRLRGDEDYGLYQIYGTHPVYGSDVLLYIGKADKQFLGVRLSQEGWSQQLDANTIQVYVGRLGGYEQISNDDWSWQITVAEQLLIYAHIPAVNSSGLNKNFDEAYQDVHVLNWGTRRSLFPEVSGKFFSNLFGDDSPTYKTFSVATPTSV